MSKRVVLLGESFTVQDEQPMADEWDNGTTSTVWSIEGFGLEDDAHYGQYENIIDSVAVPNDFEIGQAVYGVVAIVSSGDSFGQYHGKYCELMSAHHTREEALERVEHLRSVTDYSVPWNGYFDSLDSLTIRAGILL